MKPKGIELFTIQNATPEQSAFLRQSVYSVDVTDDGYGYLNFRAGFGYPSFRGPRFRLDDPNLTFEQVTKGAFIQM